MFTTKVQLRARAIRTAEELKTTVPLGGTCWVIFSGSNTKPSSFFAVTRTGETTYSSVESCDDEEGIKLLLTQQQILNGLYGGAWLQKRDAQNYFKLLTELWEQAPQAIAAQAQAHEEKIAS